MKETFLKPEPEKYSCQYLEKERIVRINLLFTAEIDMPQQEKHQIVCLITIDGVFVKNQEEKISLDWRNKRGN